MEQPLSQAPSLLISESKAGPHVLTPSRRLLNTLAWTGPGSFCSQSIGQNGSHGRSQSQGLGSEGGSGVTGCHGSRAQTLATQVAARSVFQPTFSHHGFLPDPQGGRLLGTRDHREHSHASLMSLRNGSGAASSSWLSPFLPVTLGASRVRLGPQFPTCRGDGDHSAHESEG